MSSITLQYFSNKLCTSIIKKEWFQFWSNDSLNESFHFFFFFNLLELLTRHMLCEVKQLVSLENMPYAEKLPIPSLDCFTVLYLKHKDQHCDPIKWTIKVWRIFGMEEIPIPSHDCLLFCIYNMMISIVMQSNEQLTFWLSKNSYE